MPIIILVLIALFLPRLTIVFLWLLTNWFNGVFATLLWPILGFIFLPYTLLWYSIVSHVFGGVWGPLQIVGLVVAVVVDLSSSGGGYRGYHSHYRVVEVVHPNV